MPNDLRGEAGGARNPVDDLLDHQHSLRPTETAKGGVGSKVCFCHSSAEFEVGNVIGVVEMEDGAVGHGPGEIERPAAVGEERNLRRREQAFVVETDPKLPEKRMPLPGDHHVLVTIEPDPHLASGPGGGERRQGRQGGRLRLLPPKSAAHPRTFDHHAVHRQREHVRDDMLDFRGMLGRRADENCAVFPALRPSGVRFEIKMILSAKGEFALKSMRRFRQGSSHIAAPDEVWVAVKAVPRNRLLDRENRRQRLVVDDDLGGGGATRFLRIPHHQSDDLSVIKCLLVGEQNLIMPHRADIVQAGHILGQQDRRDPRHIARRRDITPQNPGVGMRRTNRPDLEHRLGLSDIVDVNGVAGDMFVAALVRRRIVPLRQLPRNLLGGTCFRTSRLFGKKLPQKAFDHLLPVSRAAAHIRDGSEFAFEQREDHSRGLGLPGLADERCFRLPRPRRHGRDAAISDSRARDRPALA